MVYVVDYIVLYVQKKISLTYRPVYYFLFVCFIATISRSKNMHSIVTFKTPTYS